MQGLIRRLMQALDSGEIRMWGMILQSRLLMRLSMHLSIAVINAVSALITALINDN